MRERTAFSGPIFHGKFKKIPDRLTFHFCQNNLVIKWEYAEHIVKGNIALCYRRTSATAVGIANIGTHYLTEGIGTQIAKVGFLDSYKTVTVFVVGNKLGFAYCHLALA